MKLLQELNQLLESRGSPTSKHALTGKLIVEGFVDPNVMLSITNLIKRGGKNPNHFELLVVARLLQLLKAGLLATDSNIGDFMSGGSANLSTCNLLMSSLRAMQPAQLALVASRLLETLSSQEASRRYCAPTQDILPWLQMMMASEASD